MFSDGQGKPNLSENKLALTCADPIGGDLVTCIAAV